MRFVEQGLDHDGSHADIFARYPALPVIGIQPWLIAIERYSDIAVCGDDVAIMMDKMDRPFSPPPIIDHVVKSISSLLHIEVAAKDHRFDARPVLIQFIIKMVNLQIVRGQ